MAKKQTNGNLALEQQRVIVIPAHDEIIARKLRVAAYARVQPPARINSIPIVFKTNIIPNSSPAIRIGKWSTFMPTRVSPARRSKNARIFPAHDARLAAKEKSTVFWSKAFPDSLEIRKIVLRPSGNSRNLASVSSSRNRASTPARCPVRWSRRSWHRWHKSKVRPYLETSNGAFKNECRMEHSFHHIYLMAMKL